MLAALQGQRLWLEPPSTMEGHSTPHSLLTASSQPQRGEHVCASRESVALCNKSGQVWQNVQSILESAPSIKSSTSFGDSNSWLLPFAAPLLIILVILLFGPIIVNLLTEFLSCRIEAVKLPMIVLNDCQSLGLEAPGIYHGGWKDASLYLL